MPSNARKDIVREGEIGVYHVWSRCVQRAFLCGQDTVTGKNFDYRREWIEKLLIYQARLFAVDVGNYSILSNHLHAIFRTRPDLVETWSDEEVAWRWKCAWPRWERGEWICEPADEDIDLLVANPEKLLWIRNNLSSLSWLMARWKEPIARLANAEMETSGHYWEARFGSRELDGDAPALTCSLYIDLNQSKAGMADSFETSHYSAIQRRIEAWSAFQVRESLEHFGEQARPDQQLDESILRALLRDCFLAPIQVDGPLVTTTALTPRDEAVAPTAQSAEVSEPEADTAGEAVERSRHSTGSPRAGKVDKARSSKIHHRLKASLKARASDNLFLPLSIEQYFRLARWALAKWKAESAGNFDPRVTVSFQGSDVGLLAGRLPPAENWYRAIDQFHNWFFRCVGSASTLLARAASSGRTRLHGIRRCREQFG